MFIAAFLPPTARVLGFAAGILVTIAFHYHKIMTANLVFQLVLYATGGISFLRYVISCTHYYTSIFTLVLLLDPVHIQCVLLLLQESGAQSVELAQ